MITYPGILNLLVTDTGENTRATARPATDIEFHLPTEIVDTGVNQAVFNVVQTIAVGKSHNAPRQGNNPII
jgi:hypothetical protein